MLLVKDLICYHLVAFLAQPQARDANCTLALHPSRLSSSDAIAKRKCYIEVRLKHASV
jgi:hypothetical protein